MQDSTQNVHAGAEKFSGERHEIFYKVSVRVLIADDEREFARELAEMVRHGGHEVVDIVHTGLDAIRAYRRHKPQIVLMDFKMGRLNGLTACRNILSDDPAGRILFLSGLSDYRDLAPQWSGAVAVLQKPIGYAMLEQVLNDVALREPEPLATAGSTN